MRHASSVITKSIARKYFGKDPREIGRGDFERLVRRWKGPQRLLRSSEGRKALLYFLGRPHMLAVLTTSDLLQLAHTLPHVTTTFLDNGGPQELYQLAVIANVVSHTLEERAGSFLPDADAAARHKRALLRQLAHRFTDDIACADDPFRPGTVVVRLRYSDRHGLHMDRRDLPHNALRAQPPAQRQSA